MEKQFCSTEKMEFKTLMPSFVRPIQNSQLKPMGGLWTSTYLEEEGSDWIRWCEGADFCCPENGIWNGYILIPKKEARIFTVDSHDDFLDLTKKYCVVPDHFKELQERMEEKLPEFEFSLGFKTHFYEMLDAEKMAEDYDALHLTGKGFWDCKRKDFSCMFQSWDCESTLWFRWIFEECEAIRIDRKHVLTES